MKQEHIEIVEALDACDTLSESAIEQFRGINKSISIPGWKPKTTKAMTPTQIQEGNRLISEFMGYTLNPYDELIAESWQPLQFESDWSQLMPVVEKISNTVIKGTAPYNADEFVTVEINAHGFVKIYNFRDTPFFKSVSRSGSLITATWLAVVDFAKWYKDPQAIKLGTQPKNHPDALSAFLNFNIHS